MNKITKLGVDSLALILPKKDTVYFGWKAGDDCLVEITESEIKAKKIGDD